MSYCAPTKKSKRNLFSVKLCLWKTKREIPIEKVDSEDGHWWSDNVFSLRLLTSDWCRSILIEWHLSELPLSLLQLLGIHWIKEDFCRKVAGLNLVPSRIFFLWNLIKNLPFLLWFVYAISIHVRDLLISCTFDRGNMSSINKRSTMVEVLLKRYLCGDIPDIK